MYTILLIAYTATAILCYDAQHRHPPIKIQSSLGFLLMAAGAIATLNIIIYDEHEKVVELARPVFRTILAISVTWALLVYLKQKERREHE